MSATLIASQPRNNVPFSCRIDNVKIIIDILQSLSATDRKDQICQVEITEQALIFLLSGKSKSNQARAMLQADLFAEYQSSADVIFALHLSVLLDCLQLFGSSSETTSATLVYDEDDALFKISLEESGVLTTCEIATLLAEDSDQLMDDMFSVFREAPELCRLIVKSEALRDVMHEINDVHGGGAVTIAVTAGNAPSMKLSVNGSADILEAEIPQSSPAAVMMHVEAGGSWRYPNTSLQLGMKALQIAKETYLRINRDGMLSVQHQIKDVAKGYETFIDFITLAQDSGQMEE